jgi:hypothetical protein
MKSHFDVMLNRCKSQTRLDTVFFVIYLLVVSVVFLMPKSLLAADGLIGSSELDWPK